VLCSYRGGMRYAYVYILEVLQFWYANIIQHKFMLMLILIAGGVESVIICDKNNDFGRNVFVLLWKVLE